MDRRSFLKLAGLAGLTVVPTLRPRLAHANLPPYEGPLYITVHAGGGWDPTMICDPKGRQDELEVDPVNNFFVDEIEEIGAFRVAPLPVVVEFFENYQSELLVMNGIDCGTNSHQAGTQNTWSGELTEQIPALNALVAGAAGSSLPLSFISNGGYDFTADVVPPTRVPDTSAISQIAFPYRTSEFDPESNLFTDDTLARIAEAREARHERLINSSTLPREQFGMNSLFEARSGSNDLRRLVDYLPDQLDNTSDLRQQAQIAIASYRAGLTVSANLTTGGFDTHGDHDNRQTTALNRLFDGVNFLMQEAERQGVADRVVLMIGSDFARTPYYNEGNGKDHWSVTSMMMLGTGIRGGRVIGESDHRQGPMTINPSTLALDENGIRLTPAHIHRSLRKLAGLDEHNLDNQFPLAVEDLDLLS